MIELNSKEAIEHPDLIKFVQMKEALSGFRPLNLNQIEDTSIEPFSDAMIISRKFDDGSDFSFEYWGEENTKAYGFDLTGQSIMTANFGELANLFMSIDCQVISMGGTVYLNGEFDWLDKEHQKWYRVAMPLVGPRGVNRVISYTTFRVVD